tara:strand:+ start:643 stop:1725 length:1083 start_codon:yes stop_codon:yes gene_type:complete
MNPLEKIIKKKVKEKGPIALSEYMSLALTHPLYGYYMKKDPLGKNGDFITAPEISQIFGELIGLWAASTWKQMGHPQSTHLIECGPGRGTLMGDFLRATKLVPNFRSAINLHLLETSPVLKKRQLALLNSASPVWHKNMRTVPTGPTILIANEFLDSLPVQQVRKTKNGWVERLIGLKNDKLVFVEGNAIKIEQLINWNIPINAKVGAIFEMSHSNIEFAEQICTRLDFYPGYALIIDYGYRDSNGKETLQGVRKHSFADPMARPGDIDLTTHVNFGVLATYVSDRGHTAVGPISQATFLERLGVRERTKFLMRNAPQNKAKQIAIGTERLTDPKQMGKLFKAMVIMRNGSPLPAGFERN